MSITNDILSKSNKIDKEAEKLSQEMSKHEYVITESKVNPPLQKMRRMIRMMGFKEEETKQILLSVKKQIVGKHMQKGDNFHNLMKEAFTTAITEAVEKIKNK